MDLQITLRGEEANDVAFLLELYCATRRAEVAMFGWDVAQQEAFLRMQFEIQTRAYSMQFPGAIRSLIEVCGEPAGRMIVNRADNSISLIDIIVSLEFRRKGIAEDLIRQLQDDAARDAKRVELSANKENSSAISLYEKLGFGRYGESEFDIKMIWPPITDPQ